ncbi:MAG: hypothetical protein ABR499_15765 [Gemmatimonadaceae bacterium]
MCKARLMVRGFMVAGFASLLAACSAGSGGPTDPLGGDLAARGTGDGGGAAPSGGSGTLRLRCEVRPGRSKISVDGNNLSSRNATFSARVTASGGTVVSGLATAIGDEVEFDFDSERDDIAQGATAISATFITARAGPDVVAEILNAQGQVVVQAGAECEFR